MIAATQPADGWVIIHWK